MDFLGWYSTGAGEKPTSAEIAVHRQIMDINESPLFLQLSPGKPCIRFFIYIYCFKEK